MQLITIFFMMIGIDLFFSQLRKTDTKPVTSTEIVLAAILALGMGWFAVLFQLFLQGVFTASVKKGKRS